MSLANQVLDVTDDLDRGILKVAYAECPSEFKTANILTAEERDGLKPEEFALVIMTKEGQALKKFPINDPANTWLSCYYFQKTASALPFEAQKTAAISLAGACAIYGLEVPALVKQAAVGNFCGNIYREGHTKTASQKTEFIKRAADASSKHYYALADRYPMPDAEFVKKAEQYFDAHWQDFYDPSERRVFAKNVAARAEELGVKVASQNIKKYANDTYGTSLSYELLARKELLDTKPDLQKALDKLASHKTDTDADTFAKALHLFDKKAGLEKHYDRYLSDPYRATFEDQEKIAKARYGYRWEDKTAGESIDEDALVKAAEEKYDKIKGYFGETLASHLKKNAAAIFESLPSDAKLVIARIARGRI